MRKLTYSKVVSTLALVIAVGTGGAWAADQINGSQLVDESVAGRKLRDDTVRGEKVKESTLMGLVRGNARVLTGHTTRPAGSDTQVIARRFDTPVGRFVIGCSDIAADTRYRNTTPGSAEVYRTVGVVAGSEFVEEHEGTDHDRVVSPRGDDIGYAVTTADGPKRVELRVGKGRHAAILTAAANHSEESCSWTWELVSSG